jgi:type I restriction enzyme S subunit
LCAKFLYYVTASSLFRSFGEGAMKGAAGQKRVPDDFLRDFPLPLPDPKEQERITTLLDDRCAGIDEIIEKKKRLIDLLAEQKAALITRAVTRGLDPSVPMKDSGIPWLGQVPAHWRFTKFGYLVRMVSGSTPDKANANYWQGSVPWVSPKDMKTPVILDSEDHISEPAVRECGMHLLPVKSVLIVVRGMILAHSFPVAVTGVPVTINQDMKGLLPKPNCDAAFLAYYLRGTTDLMLSLIEDSAHGTKCLRTDKWKSVGLYLPDIAEQGAISAWIDEQNSRFVKVTSDLNIQIEKLREYRSALITAAVTGQINVNLVS